MSGGFFGVLICDNVTSGYSRLINEIVILITCSRVPRRKVSSRDNLFLSFSFSFRVARTVAARRDLITRAACRPRACVRACRACVHVVHHEERDEIYPMNSEMICVWLDFDDKW